MHVSLTNSLTHYIFQVAHTSDDRKAELNGFFVLNWGYLAHSGR